VRAYVTPPLLFGKVLDKKTGEPLSATITLTDNRTLDSLTSATTSDDGSLIMTLPAYGLVSINVLSPGYLFYGRDIRMDTVATTQTSTEQAFRLEPIKPGATLSLDNIYFKTGQWDLLPPSYAELERLIAFLRLNPRVWIQINGHTDNTGNAAEKLQLSLNRAESVRAYLIQRGILPLRLKVKGYGMTRPRASNRTAAGRRANRRVEFEVIKD
jgi:outer membrane protein OmpA-like peptidoglycan-associated protein